jgi:lipopolysaccharide/colanic/teichoic acid biosynthesis glycosyltransferase
VTSIRISQALPRTTTAAPPSESLRRALNVAVAAFGILVTAPLMIGIALVIKLTSRGPIFFVQTRIGIDRRAPGEPAGNTRRSSDCGGKPFTIYKFRTMATSRISNENDQVWAQPDDPRVTRIGRFLRLYRLDELPQLINVLRGDMDVVGPRPEQPTIFAQLRVQIDRYQERQRVRPGITGLAQISQTYDTCLDDVRSKLKYDLEYISRQSTLQDLRIMLGTLPVMIGKRGAW